MGLDMFLKRGKKIPKRDFSHIRKLDELVCEYEDELVIEAYKDYVIECGVNFTWHSFFEEVVYWRKANAIHKWFVDNVQYGEDDCDNYEVSKENIESLLNICKEVLENVKVEDGKVENGYTWSPTTGKVINYEDGRVITNPEVCKKLLPTKEGFFFGATEYNEYYLQDLEYTVKELEKILKEFDFENNYLVYTSSW